VTTPGSGKYDLLDQLADELAARYRRGERPALKEYLDRYPDLGEDIRALFPALVEIEQVKEDRREPPGPGGPLPAREQLGDYRLVREIGRGGMGVVYEAEQVSLGRRVALKVLPMQASKDGRALERFRREARAAAKLHHTNIVPVFEVGQQGDVWYYAMQFIAGQGLDQIIMELRHLRQKEEGERPLSSASQAARSLLTGRFRSEQLRPSTPLPSEGERTEGYLGNSSGRSSSGEAGNSSSPVLPGQAELSTVESDHRHYFRSVARIGHQAALALAHAHARGIVHRDVKPSNLLLDAAGVVWVTDFGLAKTLDESLTHTGDLLGTLRYMSPERFQGQCDARADVYGLGLTLYELLLLRPAFDSPDRLHLIEQVRQHEPVRPRAVDARVPRDLETIVLKAIAKGPERRYQSADELADDLWRFINDEPIHARREPLPERLRRWARHNPAVASLTAALLLVLVGGLIGVTWQWQRAEGARDLAAKRADDEVEARRRAESAQKAEAEAKANVEKALRRAEGLRLIAQSATLSSDPALALHLAIEGAERAPGVLANNALLAALDTCREERTLRGHESEIVGAEFTPDRQRVLTVSRSSPLAPVRVWDVGTGKAAVELVPFAYHNKSAFFSPDGQRIATLYEGYTELYLRTGTLERYTDEVVRLWDARTGKHLFVLKGHKDYVVSAAFSPDGRRLVTASWDRTARIWDVATGKELRVLRGATSALVGATFSPDGRRVLAISSGRGRSRHGAGGGGQFGGKWKLELDPERPRPYDAKELSGWGTSDGSFYGSGANDPVLARIWDAATGQELANLKHASVRLFPRFEPAFGSFSPDGRHVLIGDQKMVIFWDHAEPYKHVAPLGAKGDKMIAASFSPNGRRVLTVSPKAARLWDFPTGHPIALLRGHTRALVSARFSPDGRLVVTASADKTARIWDGVSGDAVAVLKGHEQRLSSAAFSRDSQRILTASADKTVRVWRVWPDRQHAFQLRGHTGPVTSIAFRPDGRRVVTASEDRTARIWDVVTRKEVAVLKGHGGLGRSPVRDKVLGAVAVAVFSPDGRRVLTAGDELRARVRNTFLGRTVRERDLAFTPGRLWDGESRKELLGLRWAPEKSRDLAGFQGLGYESGLSFAQFSADGKRVLTVESGRVSAGTFRASDGLGGNVHRGNAKRDRTVRVWGAVTGKEVAALKGHEDLIVSAVFSPDGRRVLTASRLAGVGNAVRLWDATTGKALFTWKQEPVCPYALFSPDGERALAFLPNKVRIWDVRTGTELPPFEGPQKRTARPSPVTIAATLSPDGRLAVAVAGDTACVWDIRTGKSLFLLEGHQRTIHSAQFSPDGRLVVTASEDETARLWETASGKEVYTLSGHEGPVRCACFSPDGQTVATASADGTARLWAVSPLPLARARAPRELTAAERRRFEIEAPRR
jgi:WD40 repeat protein/serine/threonine protein kinase